MKKWEKIEQKKRNEYNLILNNDVNIITSTKNLCKMIEVRIDKESDEVFKVVQECGKPCKNITLITE